MPDRTRQPTTPQPIRPITSIRAVVGGLLMGLANVLPGISGGTMLLAAGVYPQFIGAVADVSTFRWKWNVIWFLACIAIGAAVAIVALAAAVMGLIENYRWAMYSAFIGLTLGGLPLLWTMLRPVSVAAIVGIIIGLAFMIGLAVMQTGDPSAANVAGEREHMALFIAGVAASAAMVLPGLSGAYLLLLLGQYENILGTIDAARNAATDRQWSDLVDLLGVFVPLGIGVVIGIVAVSNAVKWLLKRFHKVTVGILFGLLLGAVIGLWPFRTPVEPQVGQVHRGVMIENVEEAREIPVRHWDIQTFTPSTVQIAGSIALIVAGFGATYGLSRLGTGTNERA